MKLRIAGMLAASALIGSGQAAFAKDHERVVKGTDSQCSIELRGSERALLMLARADGSAQIGLMFKEAVDTPGRTRDGYFSMRFDFSTSGPVTYREGYEGAFSSGYIADMSTDDLLWMLDESQGRFSYSIDSNTGFEAQTGDDIAEFAAFRGCVAELGG